MDALSITNTDDVCNCAGKTRQGLRCYFFLLLKCYKYFFLVYRGLSNIGYLSRPIGEKPLLDNSSRNNIKKPALINGQLQLKIM